MTMLHPFWQSMPIIEGARMAANIVHFRLRLSLQMLLLWILIRKMTGKKERQTSAFLTKLRQKWELKSLFQVVMVLIVFSLTGMTVVLVRPLLFDLFGYTDQTPIWLKVITYLLLVFPMYQVLILLYGAVLGQFSFFWEKEKKLFQLISRPFRQLGNGSEN
jgi:hypothetical protein